MIIKNDEYDYRVNFQYNRNGSTHPFSTTCIVERVKSGGVFKDDGVVVCNGISLCDNRDQFVKAIGRKIALKRALMSKNDLSKEERTKIWKGYFSRVSK